MARQSVLGEMRQSVSSRTVLCALIIILALSTVGCAAQQENTTEAKWISLFNGKDLTGWTPKFAGSDLGVNYKDTFRVQDGLLTVSYENYDKFNNEFGHLFYKDSFSHYRIRAEYRFIGEQVPNGPGWAFRNNGLMLHCQKPSTMAKNQNFPVSIEVQLLGGSGTGQRSTGNLCTPGTHVVMKDKLVTQHCINSSSKTYHGDQWVTAEIEVHGNRLIRHIINGEVVMEYSEPQLDDGDPDAQKLLQAGADRMLSEGYISIQAESHPTQFRKIELLPLAE
ncbi:MAG TPA: DUF1080 domain-containing protein [Sedimentisphaerales bacterium]|nr:DUF1080 domain-containing protein [Sedimentisphaerales bacterium]HQG47483.1 DUF1080 domain-containing protein [Sedimentisphaerales bacterium]